MSPRGTDSPPEHDSSDEALGATLPLEGPIPSPPPAMAGGSQGAPLAGPGAASPAGEPGYRIETELARGGIGRVMVARDLRLDRPVAIKELIELRDDALRRFEREARVTARLQHPSIVGVHEAGRWPDGRPFYAMELVQGRSLDLVVAGAQTRADRLALVPRVLAVAEALAYAHGQRIIHRDLKPANVLCGDFGETVVIDWGLAKELGGEATEPVASGPLVSQDGGTLAGTVLGTPAYMPPEQATGDAVDERVDVYALGAILYHVLSGRPPYHDAPPAEVLARVRIGSPPPLAEVAPGCPRDLCGIVDKAMARDPARRYPTARELAADLLRFQTGQLVAAHRYSPGERLRRFVGRHRGTVAVAAALLAVLAATSIYGVRRILAERDQAQRHREAAERNRETAERRRAAAEDLIEFMVGDLRQRLEPIGKVDALAAVGGAVEAYYAGLAAESPLGDREANRRAGALVLLGEARKKAGDLDGARAAYREALALQRDRTARGADAGGVAVVLTKLGYVEEQAGDSAQSLALFREALDLRARLVAAAPTPNRRLDLAESHNHVGDLHEARGDLARAVAEHRRALELALAVVADLPDDMNAGKVLFNAHMYLGDALRRQGDVDAALSNYRDGIAAAERRIARDPGDSRWHGHLKQGLGRLGTALLQAGRRDEALATLQRSLAIAEKLHRDDPVNREREASVGTELLRLGDVHRKAEAWSEALPLFRRAAAIYDRLTALDASNLGWQRDRATSHGRVGMILLALDDLDGALAEHQLALASNLALIARDPGNLGWQRDLSVRHDNIAKVLAVRGGRKGSSADIDAALGAYRESLRIAERLAAADPSNAGHREDLVIGNQNLAQLMLIEHRDREQAIGHAERALAELERLAAGKPPDRERQAWFTELRALRDRLARDRW